jgi:hypothetical protein
MDLFDAVQHYNVNDVIRLLKNGVDPNIYDGRYGITIPLFEAVHEYMSNYDTLNERDSLKIIKLLLKYGADPNKFTNQEMINSPFILPASYGDTEIVKLLLDNGADPYIIKDGKTVIEIITENAIENGNPEIVDFIMEYMDLQRVQQNLAFATSFNPRLGYDTPINDLEYDAMTYMLSNPIRSYNPSLNTRMRDEVRRDKLTKARQRSAIMRGMETNTGPFSARGVRYEPNIMKGISRHLSTMRPNTIAQSNMRLEDENAMMADYLDTLNQYGSGKRSKRGGKRSKRTKRNRRYI